MFVITSLESLLLLEAALLFDLPLPSALMIAGSEAPGFAFLSIDEAPDFGCGGLAFGAVDPLLEAEVELLVPVFLIAGPSESSLFLS